MNRYTIQLRGQVDEDEINAMSPLYLDRDWGDSAVTQFSLETDQSGFVGLLRHLHSLGYVFMSVNSVCEPKSALNHKTQ